MMIGLRRVVALVFLAVVCVGGVAGTTVPSTAAAAGDDEAGLGRMILLLDSSGSMAEPAGGGQSKIEAARSALRTVIEGLPDQAQVGLRVFGAKVFSRTDKGACTDSQLVVPPGTDNRADLSAAVGDYKPYGETPIPYALQQAAKDLGDEGARSIVLVSDGESTCAPDPCKVAADLEKGGIDLQIDVVGLSVSGAAREQLKCIAESGNGHYYDANSAGDIESRLTRVASRAVRPFTLSGQPIEGGTESDPTPIGVGDWLDTIGPANTEQSYVFERDTAGTTLRVSAVTQGEATGSDGLLVRITGPSGRQCDASVVTRTLDLRDLIGAEAVAAPDAQSDDGGECAQPGAYVITVGRGVGGAKKTVPLGLRVTEEPPIADPGFTDTSGAEVQATAPSADGAVQKVEGGVSFANATEIGAGRWSSTIVPGEALLYRVPLEFGQALRVGVTFPHQNRQIADLFKSAFPPLTQVSVFNPMRAMLRIPDAQKAYGTPDGVTLLNATAPVSRGSVDGARTGNGQSDASMAGDYYVMVSMKGEDYTPILPFRIDVEVVGDPATGPTYADGSTWSVADGSSGAGDVTDSPSPSTGATEAPEGSAATATDDDAGDGGSAMPVVAGIVGVAGVGAILAALLLWRRRQGA